MAWRIWRIRKAMSRSKHTDPAAIRAARRLREPRAKRGARDRSRGRDGRRSLKAIGLFRARTVSLQKINLARQPRVIIHRAAIGFRHPLTKPQILNLLNRVGPIAH